MIDKEKNIDIISDSNMIYMIEINFLKRQQILASFPNLDEYEIEFKKKMIFECSIYF